MKNKIIVLTGGPCAGKTTCIQEMKDIFGEKDIFYVDETFSKYLKDKSTDIFEKEMLFFKEQLRKEEIALKSNKRIIICDRGLMDAKAFLSNEKFKKLLKFYNLTEEKIMDRYDFVIFSNTCALCSDEIYLKNNNFRRKKTPEQAREINKKMFSCWSKHHNFINIEATLNFDKKKNNIIKAIHKIKTN